MNASCQSRTTRRLRRLEPLGHARQAEQHAHKGRAYHWVRGWERGRLPGRWEGAYGQPDRELPCLLLCRRLRHQASARAPKVWEGGWVREECQVVTVRPSVLFLERNGAASRRSRCSLRLRTLGVGSHCKRQGNARARARHKMRLMPHMRFADFELRLRARRGLGSGGCSEAEGLCYGVWYPRAGRDRRRGNGKVEML